MIFKLNHYRTELELLAACKEDNRKAQQQLFEEQSPVMLSVCRRYLKDEHLAEEMMITGFAKVFEKLHQFKSEGSFQGWIRRIMVNTCLAWIRKNREMYVEVEIEQVADSLDYTLLEDSLEAKDLLQLIEDLPQGYRTIFNLYAIEGYTHDEIAEQLGISSGTSKSQLSRARKLLQQRLSQVSDENEIRKNGG